MLRMLHDLGLSLIGHRGRLGANPGRYSKLEYIMEHIQNALFDLYDVRAALSRVVKNQEKSDGSDETIGDALDNAIEFLEQLEAAQ